jgi:2-dehydro-3-deoxyglucarate aldolase
MIGCWCTLASPISTEILGLAGFDWLQIDCEHSLNDPLTIVPQLMALKDSVSAPVIRPPWNDTVLIKRFLDAGVYNFLIPYVECAEEARRAVAATRYPPAGVRGLGILVRSSKWATQPGYLKTINDNIALIVQVESAKGLENVREIAAVDGVDAIFCGPGDLSTCLGHINDPHVPEVQDAIRHIAETALAAGKAAAILAGSQEDARRYAGWGYTCIAVGNDAGILRNGARALMDSYQ